MVSPNSASEARRTQAAATPDARRAAMAILAESETPELASCIASIGALPDCDEIRKPEQGLVMITGRAGGDGAPFNLGEATVARAAVRLASGEVGFGYVLGRDGEKARLIALCDAMLQRPDLQHRVKHCVLDPIRERLQSARKRAAERTAATRVDFFTLVRGED